MRVEGKRGGLGDWGGRCVEVQKMEVEKEASGTVMGTMVKSRK
jgi:hypothetical protein